MAKNPLFSTYRQGENRVTSSMLAVFERIDLSLLEAILQAASGESSLQMVTFSNQPTSLAGSVPDGRISARFSYWFEVKTAPNAVRADQLEAHVSNLSGGAGDERLFVITPDLAEPAEIVMIGSDQVTWFSFAALHEAIDSALESRTTVVSEQSRFLLLELQALLVEDGLLDTDDTVIVAARAAYPEYLDYAAYICQPGRAFRHGLTHLGFYAGGAIQPEVARIWHREDDVLFTTTEADRRIQGSGTENEIGRLITTLLGRGLRQEGEIYQVFLLSPAAHDDTVHLASPIKNDTTTSSGKPWAWTLQQRYVRLARLTDPGVSVTSHL